MEQLSQQAMGLCAATTPIPSLWVVPVHQPQASSIVHRTWTNQSILKEISPGISLEGMMLKLKLQYFGHLM